VNAPQGLFLPKNIYCIYCKSYAVSIEIVNKIGIAYKLGQQLTVSNKLAFKLNLFINIPLFRSNLNLLFFVFFVKNQINYLLIINESRVKIFSKGKYLYLLM
jgi:hypothetical protein